VKNLIVLVIVFRFSDSHQYAIKYKKIVKRTYATNFSSPTNVFNCSNGTDSIDDNDESGESTMKSRAVEIEGEQTNSSITKQKVQLPKQNKTKQNKTKKRPIS
jgi:hypothetical protein